MRILILGGTGAIGLLLIREALEHHHTVTVYARSPEKLPEDITKNTAVVVIKGQLLDEDQLSKAMEGVNAVISALGPAVLRGPFHPSDTPLAKAYSLLIKVMHRYDVKRLIALGTSSIRDPNDKPNVCLCTFFAPSLL
jgi:putative NADH-flavin reductase